MNRTNQSASTPHQTIPLRETWRNLMKVADSRAPKLRNSIIGLALAAALHGLTFACIMPIFQALITFQDWSLALKWLIAMTLLTIVTSTVRWLAQSYDYEGDMNYATHELRCKMGEHLRRIPLEKLQEKRAGEFISTLIGNVHENLSYVLTVTNILATALITPVVVSIIALFFDWRLGLMLLLIFPVIIPLYRWRRPFFGKGMRKLAHANEAVNADILEYTQGLPVLRAACCAGEKAQQLRKSVLNLEEVQIIGNKKGATPNLIITTIIELGILLVVVLGTALASYGDMDIAILAAVLVLAVRFSELLSLFVLVFMVVDMAEAALQKISAVFAIQPLPQLNPASKPQAFFAQFSNVTFHYANSEINILDNVSICFPTHSLTALVGPSGSGKTTIARLLMRHADAQHGQISIGGVDIRSIEPEQLNALIAMVFQDVYLFDDTILANIHMARPNATQEEVHAAAKAANCHEFITRMPNGYQTRVGDIGGRLSGGERQRISIARAILKNAPIVILDEPTAALDTQSEVAVQKAIDVLIQERTIIVIAHRLSTIAAADNIIVIDQGQVTQQGKHTDLLNQGGRYAAMWQAQTKSKQWHAKN